MADIFLSYVKGDRDRARLVAEELEAKGWHVFWDQEIPVGETWASHIEVQLREASAVVVLWSEASIESVWVGKEARFAEREGKYVPALIDDVAPPFEFEHVQAANLIGWKAAESGEGFERLLSAISRRVPLPIPEEQELRTEPPEAEDEPRADEAAAAGGQGRDGEPEGSHEPQMASRFRDWVAGIDRRIWIGGSVGLAVAVVALVAWQIRTPELPSEPHRPDRIGRWHAVISSYSVFRERSCDLARSDVQEFARLLGGQGYDSLFVYVARTDTLYAVTVDAGDDSELAGQVSTLIRERSVDSADGKTGSDSYVQGTPDWFSVDDTCTEFALISE